MISIGRNNEIRRKFFLEKTLLNLPSGLSIIDVGAGEMANKVYTSHLNYTSQDFCQYNGTGDGVGLHTKVWDTNNIDIISDICEIPVADNSFDVVLCTEVLEHVPDPVAALKELARITKCDGQLIITAPFCSLTHFAPFHFCTGFSSYWYKKHLSDLNFEINKFDHNGGWFDYLAQEIFRLPYIGKTYSSRTLGFTGFIFSLPLLFILSLLKKIDRGSHEMLTYGFHVVAIKSR